MARKRCRIRPISVSNSGVLYIKGKRVVPPERKTITFERTDDGFIARCGDIVCTGSTQLGVLKQINAILQGENTPDA